MIQPYWTSRCGRHVLYNADCLEVLPGLTGVDAVVADIPYGEVNRASGGLRNLDKGNADVETFRLSDVIEHASRIGNSVYIWCGTEQVSELRAGFVSHGMTTRMCGWEKANPSPMNGDKFWLSSFECCVFGRKSKAYFSEHCASPIWRGPVERGQEHPTQKPVWLMRKLIEASVPEHGTCLDFCTGSGTTGVACIRTGRRFIGIEISREYCDIAVKRMERELSQPKLPGMEPERMVQRELLEAR